MIEAGLVSVTFRQLSPEEIVGLVRRAGLTGLEWGGDVHVPHGDLERARTVRRVTEQAGLRVFAYGSYFRAGEHGRRATPFHDILETAVALGAPLIRIWAGGRGSGDADADYVARVIGDSRTAADEAADRGVRIAFEFHAGSLTDRVEAAERLLGTVDHPNVSAYWQTVIGASPEANLHDLRRLLPWLSHVHVFHWEEDGPVRRPLSEGAADWSRYLAEVAGSGRDHAAMLEFVADDRPEQFLEDAAELHRLLRGLGQAPDQPHGAADEQDEATHGEDGQAV